MTHAYAFDKGILLDNISQLSLGPRTRYLHSAVALIVPCTSTALSGLLCSVESQQACTAGQPLQVAWPWGGSSCLELLYLLEGPSVGQSPHLVARLILGRHYASCIEETFHTMLEESPALIKYYLHAVNMVLSWTRQKIKVARSCNFWYITRIQGSTAVFNARFFLTRAAHTDGQRH